jgi:hypothetical protein
MHHGCQNLDFFSAEGVERIQNDRHEYCNGNYYFQEELAFS